MASTEEAVPLMRCHRERSNLGLPDPIAKHMHYCSDRHLAWYLTGEYREDV